MAPIETIIDQPATVQPGNGEEWTVKAHLRAKGGGGHFFVFAESDEEPDALILDRQVLRLDGVQLAAFNESMANYNEVTDRHSNWTVGWLIAIMVICVVWVVGSLLYVNIRYPEWDPDQLSWWAILTAPCFLFFLPYMFIILPMRSKFYPRMREERDAFRAAIIHERYPDIALADIGHYALLADKVEKHIVNRDERGDEKVDHQTA